jgi:2-(1,2-epoxy-1,2-dihydrophenyl)acetyl-CoA isomerase
MLMLARLVTADEAVAWGLADAAVPRERLGAEGFKRAHALAQGPTIAYGVVRRLIRTALDVDLELGLRAELDACIRCGATADAREGIVSFVEHRTPRFAGR